MRRTTKILFTLSIVLNVLLFGIVAGHFVKKVKHDRGAKHARVEMAPESRQIVARNFREARETMRDDRQHIEALKVQLKTVIAAQDFDTAAFEQVMDEVTKREAIMHENRSRVLGQVLSELPYDERQKMGARLLRGLDKNRGRGGDSGGSGRDDARDDARNGQFRRDDVNREMKPTLGE